MESISGLSLFDPIPLLEGDQTRTGDNSIGHLFLNKRVNQIDDCNNPNHIDNDDTDNVVIKLQSYDDDDISNHSNENQSRSSLFNNIIDSDQQERRVSTDTITDHEEYICNSNMWIDSINSIQSTTVLDPSFSLPREESSIAFMSCVSLFNEDSSLPNNIDNNNNSNICDDIEDKTRESDAVLLRSSSSQKSLIEEPSSVIEPGDEAVSSLPLPSTTSTTAITVLTDANILNYDTCDEKLHHNDDLHLNMITSTTTTTTTIKNLSFRMISSAVSESGATTSSNDGEEDEEDNNVRNLIKFDNDDMGMIDEKIDEATTIEAHEQVELESPNEISDTVQPCENGEYNEISSPEVGWKFNLDAVEYVPSFSPYSNSSPAGFGNICGDGLSPRSTGDSYRYEYNVTGPIINVLNRVRCHQGRSKCNRRRRAESGYNSTLQLTSEQVENVMFPIIRYGATYISSKREVDPRILKSNAYRIRMNVDADMLKGGANGNSVGAERSPTLSYVHNDDILMEFMDDQRSGNIEDSPPGSPKSSSGRRRNRSRRGKNKSKDKICTNKIVDDDPFAQRLLESNVDDTPHVKSSGARPAPITTESKKTSWKASSDLNKTRDRTNGETSSGKLSTWSRELREAGGEDILYKYNRSIKALFNKLSNTNKNRIIYQRLASTVVEFLKEYKEDAHLHLSQLLGGNIINAVKNHPSGNSLIIKATFALFYITTKWVHGDEFNFIMESPLRTCLIKTLHESIKTRSNSLNSKSNKSEPLEKINAIKDEYRALLEFAWALSAHGILPNRVLRRMMLKFANELKNGEIIIFEKLITVMLSGRSYIHQMGGEAFQKCNQTWKACVGSIRQKIEFFVESWDSHSRAEASRLSVLLEIAEAESSLQADDRSAECYPRQSIETVAMMKAFKASQFVYEEW